MLHIHALSPGCHLSVTSVSPVPDTHLVAGEDPEGLHHLFSSVSVGRLTRHEVKEGVKGHRARVVGVNDGHDALEVSLTLMDRQDGRNISFTQVSVTQNPLFFFNVTW